MTMNQCPNCGQPVCSDCGQHHSGQVGAKARQAVMSMAMQNPPGKGIYNAVHVAAKQNFSKLPVSWDAVPSPSTPPPPVVVVGKQLVDPNWWGPYNAQCHGAQKLVYLFVFAWTSNYQWGGTTENQIRSRWASPTEAVLEWYSAHPAPSSWSQEGMLSVAYSADRIAELLGTTAFTDFIRASMPTHT